MVRIATVQDAEHLEILNNEFGLVCVQLKKSFCYDDYMPEITEVYVQPQYRCNGIARAMITYAEEYCKSHYPLHKFELLTGDENDGAQSVYAKLGYREDGELHLAKRFTRKKSMDKDWIFDCVLLSD